MRQAVLGDIHGNLEAFQAVLDDLGMRGGFDEILCLGDLVGYGPDPHECVELLRQHRHACVVGNHDRAATGEIDTSDFNPYAAGAARWTSQHLAPEDVEYLRSLPLTLRRDRFTLVHGSPRDPIWEYVVSAKSAAENLVYFDTDHCLLGHSHVPVVFRCDKKGDGDCAVQTFSLGEPVELSEECLIVNPGAVGQPRDGDPRASYILLDTDAGTMKHYRVDYDIFWTQAKMSREGLPSPLISRLSYGR